ERHRDLADVAIHECKAMRCTEREGFGPAGTIHLQRVDAGATVDDITAVTGIPDEAVVAAAQEGDVVATAARHDVIAVAGNDEVGGPGWLFRVADDGDVGRYLVRRDDVAGV